MSYKSALEINIEPQPVFNIGEFAVTETMISCLITVGALILFAIIVRVFFIPRWKKENRIKSGFRIFLEYIVNIFDNTAKEQTGHNYKFTSAFYFACSSFICIATLIEMFGLRPATTDLSLTLMFGILTFIIIFTMGFKEKKARRLLHYLNPFVLLSDIVLPFSIALRMFGSVLCGYLIMHIVYALFPDWVLYTGVVGAIGNVIFTLFHALIQAYVYMFLSMSLINEATE